VLRAQVPLYYRERPLLLQRETFNNTIFVNNPHVDGDEAAAMCSVHRYPCTFVHTHLINIGGRHCLVHHRA